MEILSKTKDISERLFYIHECAVRAWDKYTLREYIRSGLYHKQGLILLSEKPLIPSNSDFNLPEMVLIASVPQAPFLVFSETYFPIP